MPRTLFCLLVLAFLLAGCDGVPQLRPREPSASGRIALVGEEGDLYTVRPNGGGLTRLTRVGDQDAEGRRAVHFWPSWSPDARRIASVRAEVRDGRGTGTALYVMPAGGGEAQRLAGDASIQPFFHAWAPDGRSLAVVSQEGRTLTLRTMSTGGSVGAPLVDGRQIYFDWSPDGRSLATHVDGDAAELPSARVGLRSSVGEAAHAELAVRPNAFRAPALVDRGRALLASGADAAGRSVLQRWPVDGSAPTPLMATEGVPAFLVSPRGDRAAVAEGFGCIDGVYTGIKLVDLATGATTELYGGPMVAFFWSPSGDRLAWIAIDLPGGDMSWFVGDGHGRPTRLTAYRPSAAFATMLPFFDQVAATVDVWAPDGRSLVFPGWVDEGDDGPSQVWVVDVAAGTAPRPVATGQLASWAPR